ncbi:MAG: AMP-binding protein, partial [Clostridia bacterium]|nr:AMP-binding protein [Clostridia bacterium]
MNCKLHEISEFNSIGEMLEIARSAGGHIAFSYRTNDTIRHISYAEFCHDVSSLLFAVNELGIDNCHIACLAENRYEWINTYLTVLCSRGVFVPIDREMTEDEIVNILIHSDSEVLFCSGLYEPLIQANKDKLDNIKYVISFDREEDEENFLSFELLRHRGEMRLAGEEEPLFEAREPDEMAMLVYTSGTADNPKGVMLSEKSIISCVKGGLRLCKLEGCALSLLRYSHAYSAVCEILGNIYSRTTICINESPKSINTNFNLYEPTHIYTVPAFLEAMYQRIWKNADELGKKKMLQNYITVSKHARKINLDAGKSIFTSLHKALGGKLNKIICG